MQVTLKSTGSADVVLCHGADYVGQTGYFLGPMGEGATETAWQVQPVSGIRAAARKIYDRSNASNEFDLSVNVEFADEAAATAFRLAWAESLPRLGASLAVLHSAHVLQTYSPALMDRCRIVQTGVWCAVTYHFQCGAPVTTDPTPA